MTLDEIATLIHRRAETAHVDYKAGFEWNKEHRDHQLEFIRDMIAMANTQDGGTLILGVEDGTYNLIGVSAEILASLDQSYVGQMLYDYSAPKLSFELQKTEVDKIDVVVIQISEFNDVPILCTDTAFGKNPTKPILRRGAVYIRNEAAQTEEVSSDHEMRQLLNRAVLKRGDELLRSFERIVKGKPIAASDETLSRYGAELAQAQQWFVQVLGKGFLNVARWEVRSYPTQFIENRVDELPHLERLVRDSQVNLRGGPFPYLLSTTKTGMFNSGYQGFFDGTLIREGFRLYKSGHFVCIRSLWEDMQNHKDEAGRKVLSFISAIYSLTEYLLFLKRLYENMGNIEHFHISVRLIGCQQRVLASFEPLVPLFDSYESQEETIEFSQNFQMVELQVKAEEIARSIARNIFHVFNWTDVSDDIIQRWQAKLLASK
ncbi:MAG TPA: ATP-binding protein [Nitrospiraceae bacterium]|jgi:hypothetical protein|nr:ATP-binding protein [Nitrospiraceae bacterium]